MDEAGARDWLVSELDVSRETLGRLDALVALLREENTRQNLVSAASLNAVWVRHIVDSAQLLLHARDRMGAWLDLGSGAGFPGLVVAALRPDHPVALVESRRLRADWLQRAADVLDMRNIRVIPLSAEKAPQQSATVITARAFAPLPRLFALAHRFSTEETLWVLPKGRSAPDELASVRTAWQCIAEMKPSITDPEAAIIVARHVRPLRGALR